MNLWSMHASTLLELAIWKIKITEYFGQNNDCLLLEMKMQCRADSISMVTIVVHNVLSFITDRNGGSDVADNEDANGSSSNDDDGEWLEEEVDGSIFDGDEDNVNGLAKEIGETAMIAMQAMVNGGAKSMNIMLMAMKAMVNGDEDCGEDIDDNF